MSLNRDDNRFDILRLFAAWLVLFSHCYPLGARGDSEPLASTSGIDTMGGVGVAIFFVLSGYLVTLSLERSPSVREFARRRALRIYPALVTVCLLSVLVLGPLMTTWSQAVYWQHGGTWDYLQTASALRIRYPLPGVFASNPMPTAVNGALWSLPYELTCYGVLALASLLPGPLRYKVPLLGLGLVAVLLLRPAYVATGPFDLLWGMDYYHGKLGVLFVLGAVFACWRDHIRPMAWPALLLLVVALYLPHGVWQLLPYLLGVGMLTLWLALYARWLPRVPQRIGDWSYGAYLYGFPVQQVLAHFKLHEVSFVAYVLASTVVTFALAGLSWHVVEKQALRWK
ncbi:MAG: acyltransferase [Pseudomonadota bacterium]